MKILACIVVQAGLGRVVTAAVVFGFSGIAQSQGLNNLWQGGFEYISGPPWGGSDIEFSSGAAVISSAPDRVISLKHTAANISDAGGGLLFFTNGVVVGRADGDTMFNGAGLNPSEYTDDWYPEALLLYQANLIIPDPGNADRYYLFHNTVDTLPGFTSRFQYVSVVDMSLDGGHGAVVSKNQVIHTGDLQYGRIGAVRHGNGRDWWVYVHELNNNVFLRWIVTPGGLVGPQAEGAGIVRTPDAGMVSFSENGERLAYYSGELGLDLFNVDRCDGSLAFVGHVDVVDAYYGYGVSFSPSGRFIYLSGVTHLYQVDAEAADLQGSVQLLADWDSTYSPGPPFATLFGASKLAPDGKIYLSTMNGTDKLHVINYPDSLGLACDIVQHGITLPTYWKNSIPNHPNYHLGALDGSICDSLDVGLVEQPENLNLSLYPNPNSGAFALSFAPQADAGLLEVHALDGRLVHREGVAAWSQLKRVALPALNAGVYQCKLQFGEAAAVIRFVVDQ